MSPKTAIEAQFRPETPQKAAKHRVENLDEVRAQAPLPDAEIRQMYLAGAHELEALSADLAKVHEELMAGIGPQDVAQMRYVRKLSRKLEKWGRSKIRRSRTLEQWWQGVLFLAGHYVAEITNGHAIAHAIYDELCEDDDLHSRKFEWNMAMHPQRWRYDHIENHHPNTNVVAEDHDLLFFLYRSSPKQAFKPHHLVQVPLMLAKPLWLQAFLAFYMPISEAKGRGADPFSWDNLKNSFARIWRHILPNYAEPLVEKNSLAAKTKVLPGFALANLLANYHILFMVSVEHYNDRLQFYEYNPDETRAQYYLRQIVSTVNFYTNHRHEDLFTSGVSSHIEHHLFVDLPVHRMREAGEKVRQVCFKHGIPYRAEYWQDSIRQTLTTLLKTSLPIREGETPEFFLKNPWQLVKRVAESVKEWSYIGDIRNRGPVTAEVSSVDYNREDKVARIRIRIPGAVKSKRWPGGSYIHLQLPGQSLVRQFSLLADSNDEEFSIAVRAVGTVGSALAGLQAGAELTLLAEPAVKFTLASFRFPKLIVTAGMGVTAVSAMLADYNAYQGPKGGLTVVAVDCPPSLQRMLPAETSFITAGELPATLTGLRSLVGSTEKMEVYANGDARVVNQVTAFFKNDTPGRIYAESFQPVQANGPQGLVKTFSGKLKSGPKIEIRSDETVLAALERAGVKHRSGCHKGLCKACLIGIKGRVNIAGEMKTTEGDSVAACNAKAASDLELLI